MTNPFEALNISDDEDTFQPTTAEQKVKRTHQEKRLYKQQQQTSKVAASSQPAFTESVPERVKEDAKQIRNTRHPPTPLNKKLGDGHYLDRRSGTGRVDKPRKEGGGWGNVGNVKDEFKKDKYIKQTPEETKPATEAPVEAAEPVAEPKPEEPQALTLEEYYKTKGVEISSTFEKKAPVKKTDLNAEWIKKEKLTVLESKEDKKISERNGQTVVKQSSVRVGLDENLGGLGFGQKPARQEQRRDQKHEPRGKGKKGVVIHEQDFPSL